MIHACLQMHFSLIDCWQVSLVTGVMDKNIPEFSLCTWHVWWADLGWLTDGHPAALPLLLFNKIGENEEEKLLGRNKDRDQ